MTNVLDEHPVVVSFPLHWGEMDALGHVNNARFFTWFESARIALFTRLGVRPSQPSNVGPILASTRCDFLVPVVYPAEIAVGVRVANVGNTSIEMHYVVCRTDTPDVACARGSSVAVLIDYATGQKVRVPDAVRQAIAELASGAVSARP